MNTVHLRLDGDIGIYRAAELKEVLLAPLAPGVMLELDLSGVSEIDTAGVQLLLLANNSAQALGATLRLCAPSAAVVQVLDLLNLGGTFGDPDGATDCQPMEPIQ